MTDLSEKIVLITGAGGGFGLHMTRQFRDAGCTLVLTDINDRALRPAIDDAGDALLASVTADLATEEGCGVIAGMCTARGMQPDVLVNNAGVGFGGRLDHVPRDKWEMLMQLNLLAPMRLCNLFLPAMIERGSGHVVNISSLAGWIGSPGLSSYCASKFGLRGFGESLAADLEDTGVQVSNVYPCFSRTPILDSPQFGYEERRGIPENLISEPTDVVTQIIKGVRKNRLHIFPDKHSWRIHYLKRYMPWVISLLNRRMQTTQLQQAKRRVEVASIRSRIVRYFSGQYMSRITPDKDVHKLRAGLEYRGTLLPPAKGVDIQPTTIEGIHCEWHVPPGCENAPVLYYLHGGIYIMGSPATHRRLVSYIAQAAGMRALVPDYRLAPENRFPAALEDSLKVYRRLLHEGFDPSAMAFGGDSAGGNLAMSTLLALRDADDALPAACFLISPWLDMTNDGESRRSRAEIDPWFNPDHVPASAARMFSACELRNPLVSPVFADASGLPPTLIQVGDHEILLSDSTRMAENIQQAGGEVELELWPDMWHVFQFFIGQMPESMQAINDIGRFLRSRLSSEQGEMQKGQAA